MTELADKLSEIYKTSTVKTIGDLVDAERLDDLDHLPQAVRDCPIGVSSEDDTLSILPGEAYSEMQNAGLSDDAINTLVEKVVEFKLTMVEQAYAAITLVP